MKGKWNKMWNEYRSYCFLNIRSTTNKLSSLFTSLKGPRMKQSEVCLTRNQVSVLVHAGGFPSHLDLWSEGFLGCLDFLFACGGHGELKDKIHTLTCDLQMVKAPLDSLILILSKRLWTCWTFLLWSSFAWSLSVQQFSILKGEPSNPRVFSMA